MAKTSPIEWTDETWNPIVGCSVLSPGCTNCYAMKMAGRLDAVSQAHEAADGGDPGPLEHYRGLTRETRAGAVWTGKLRQAPEHLLTRPLRWRKGRRIFVNSMSDLFHEAVPDEWIDRVFAVMALCPQHTFQVLTKRAARMRAYFGGDQLQWRIDAFMDELIRERVDPLARRTDDLRATAPDLDETWPLPNVWLGVSVEDQQRAVERVPDLLATPAAVRFLSCEPLLGPILLEEAWHGECALSSECWGDCNWCRNGADFPPLWNCQAWRQSDADYEKGRSGVDWVICGGESGPGARPMHPDWARSLRDQCAAAGVPFFFKQWGEHAPGEIAGDYLNPDRAAKGLRLFDGKWDEAWSYPDGHCDDEPDVYRLGKKAAGRQLDGVEHSGMPDPAKAA